MKLKQKLKAGINVFGTWCIIPSPEVSSILAKSGLDFILIDMEHGPMDYTIAQRMVMAAEADGCEALIRVAENNEGSILKALDIGASGVIVPHVESAEQRQQAISYIKYPPDGLRGFTPYTRAGGYHSQKEITINENKRTIAGIIVEGKTAIENITEIIDDPYLDVIYIGTYDLSVDLGVPGEVSNRRVLELVEKAVHEIKKAGKTAGCLFHDKNDLEYFNNIGIQFLAYKVDTSVLFDEFSKAKGGLK